MTDGSCGGGAGASGGRSGSPPAGLDNLDERGLPPRYIDGSPNPAHWRAKYALVSDLITDVALGRNELPRGFNPKQVQDFIGAEARQHGLDPKHLQDTRTEAEKALDCINAIVAAPETVFERTDDELNAVLACMNGADERVERYMKSEEAKANDKKLHNIESYGPKARGRLERCRATIEGVLSMRDRARRPVPSGSSPTKAAYLRGAHTLRFMAYVGRSNMPKSDDSRAAMVYRWGDHHAKMSADLWEARDQVKLKWDKKAERHKWARGELKYQGCILVCPPGHGKSELCCMVMVKEVDLNQRLQSVYLHAKADEAEKNKQYIASYFSLDTEGGRRNYALFPYNLADRDNNATSMRLALKSPLKQPTLQAYGVKAKALGINTNFQVKDDIVPQSDRDEDEERRRRYDLITNTWNTRQRGEEHFDLMVGTLWHHDDALMRFIKLARESKIMYRVSIQSTGGPRTTPKFKSLWDEVYPAAELKKRYNQMRDPILWSANYMANPIADEGRIVQKLAYYDPLCAQHAAFLQDRNTQRHLSADPAATSRAKSDKAGMVYAAVGEVRTTRTMPSGTTAVDTVMRCRVLDAKQIHATQLELTDVLAAFAGDHRVDYCHVETVAGFVAMAEMLEAMYGITPIQHTTGNMNKERRLRGVATMLENAHPGIDAVVEFPGKVQENDDGSVVLDEHGEPVVGPDPAYEWLYRQVLDFGVTAEDHCLDAMTQLFKYIAPTVGVGEGAVTAQVRRGELKRASRKAQAVRAMLRGDTESKMTASEEEVGYFVGVGV